MIDKEKIETLFTRLENYLNELNDLKKLSEDKYLNDSRNIYSSRYLLQISIETCISIGNHIISREELGVPKEYADTFRILKNNNIISEPLLDKLLLMSRFRNRLVHLYWDIDDKLVFEIIKNNYKDFLKFKREILEYIKKVL